MPDTDKQRRAPPAQFTPLRRQARTARKGHATVPFDPARLSRGQRVHTGTHDGVDLAGRQLHMGLPVALQPAR